MKREAEKNLSKWFDYYLIEKFGVLFVALH